MAKNQGNMTINKVLDRTIWLLVGMLLASTAATMAIKRKEEVVIATEAEEVVTE